MFKINKSLNLVRLLGLQLILLTLSILAWGIVSYHDAYSALLGGLVCILPNLIFAYQFFRNLHKKLPLQVIKSFYLGEFIKLAINVSLLLIILIKLNVNVIALLSSYLITYLGIWFIPFWRPIR